jgi:hypothetical protein
MPRAPAPIWKGGPLPNRRHDWFIVFAVCDGLDPKVAYTKAGFKAKSEQSARSAASRLLHAVPKSMTMDPIKSTQHIPWTRRKRLTENDYPRMA